MTLYAKDQAFSGISMSSSGEFQLVAVVCENILYNILICCVKRDAGNPILNL